MNKEIKIKMKIIRNDVLPPKWLKAITIGPFIFTRPKTWLGTRDINHERIHWEQEKELLIVGFYVLYVAFFLWRLVECAVTGYRMEFITGKRLGLWKTAYRRIPFEREAYCCECVIGYVHRRERMAWKRYCNC